MIDIDIREAALSDEPMIRAFLEHEGMVTRGILAADTHYWMALDESGVCVGVIGAEYGMRSSLLRSALVLPEARKRHIGRRLTERACEQSRASGRHIVYCFSTGAGAYWQKHGFRKVTVAEVVEAHPHAPQVLHFAELGWLPTEIAWRKDL